MWRKKCGSQQKPMRSQKNTHAHTATFWLPFGLIWRIRSNLSATRHATRNKRIVPRKERYTHQKQVNKQQLRAHKKTRNIYFALVLPTCSCNLYGNKWRACMWLCAWVQAGTIETKEALTKDEKSDARIRTHTLRSYAHTFPVRCIRSKRERKMIKKRIGGKNCQWKSHTQTHTRLSIGHGIPIYHSVSQRLIWLYRKFIVCLVRWVWFKRRCTSKKQRTNHIKRTLISETRAMDAAKGIFYWVYLLKPTPYLWGSNKKIPLYYHGSNKSPNDYRPHAVTLSSTLDRRKEAKKNQLECNLMNTRYMGRERERQRW